MELLHASHLPTFHKCLPPGTPPPQLELPMPLLYTLLASFLRHLLSFLALLPSPHTFLAPFSPFTSPEPLLTPSRCFLISPTLPALTTCFDTFTVPHNTYTPLSYALSQPSSLQLEDWAKLVQRMMDINRNCTNLGRDIPESLRLNFGVREWRGYCVLYETSTVPLPSGSSSPSSSISKPDPCACTQPKHIFSKGWGTLITPSSPPSQARDIHISAPHPHFDLGTVEQAAAVFAGTGARSLSIAGRARTSFLQESGCVRGGEGGGKYWMTDPAHNDKEPFFTTSLQIHAWQYAQPRGCPASKCAFIQFHGKGERTCVGDDVFLSTGLGSSPSSIAFYTSPHLRAFKQLYASLVSTFSSPQAPHSRHLSSPSPSPSSSLNLNLKHQEAHPTTSEWDEAKEQRYTISTPATSHCILTATKNVVGRYINGVERGEVCWRGARAGRDTLQFRHSGSNVAQSTPEFWDGVSDAADTNLIDAVSRGARGDFIHIEQSPRSRSVENWERWVDAVKGAFEVVGEGPGLGFDFGSEGEGGELEENRDGEGESETLGDVALRGLYRGYFNVDLDPGVDFGFLYFLMGYMGVINRF